MIPTQQAYPPHRRTKFEDASTPTRIFNNKPPGPIRQYMPYEYQKNEAGDYVCGQCGVTKRNQNTMHYHLKRHEGKLPFECEFCSKGFLQASTLQLHVAARHAHESAARLCCPLCPYKTLTKANRVLHYIRKHCASDLAAFSAGSKEGMACAGCGKACRSQTSYLYHIASAGCLVLRCEQQRACLAGLLA